MNGLRDFIARAFATTAFRLAVAGMTVFLVGGAVVAWLLFRQTNAVLTDQTLATIKAEASVLERAASQRGISGVADAVTLLSRPEGPGLYFLADPSGAKLAGNLNRVPPEIAGDPAGGLFHFEAGSGEVASNRIGVAIPVALKTGGMLYVGRDVDAQTQFAERLRRIFLGGFLALGVTGLLAGLAMSRLALSRIETMTAASRKIMAGRLSERIPLAGSGDEMDGLAESFNEMLDRIEQLMVGMKEVSDNIAHDLRTPLNRMRNRAEAALRDAGGPDACRAGLERTIEDADELIKTFNALLLIAKLEAGAVQETAVPFDAGALVRDVAELYEPVAEEAEESLSVTAPEGLVVRANRQLVGQAVANLIDNAIKYGAHSEGRPPPAAQPIDVAVKATPGGIEISVADNGPGISAADRERVLRRFVRLEESRTRPGTGLGLSLVAAVARLHGGSVRLEDNVPGLRIVLVLPNERAVAST